MAHFRIKDLDSLINDNVGNTEMLNQVRRAMQRGEPVSAMEHAYVQSLIDVHREPNPKKPNPSVTTESSSTQTASQEVIRHIVVPEQKQSKAQSCKNVLRQARRRIFRKKIIILVLVAIIVASGAVYGNMLRTQLANPSVVPSGAVLPDGVMLNTDQKTYSYGDIILVSGRTVPGESVSLEITGTKGAIWEEQVIANNAGIYSTIVIAGGQGWSEGTTYSVTATNPVAKHSAEFVFAQ